ncbi:hypothetical protein L3Y34_005961 [Caenorhabditis briggsae]|uniref:Uncharacterized protein n=1 Tax=Caenorhabditis briggsae TaxID=6238 RepID=A0AAE8ZYA3_CAEBR|nr:hypothetical protein L3Y34_005961 [Caenorhabditis briggsae]
MSVFKRPSNSTPQAAHRRRPSAVCARGMAAICQRDSPPSWTSTSSQCQRPSSKSPHTVPYDTRFPVLMLSTVIYPIEKFSISQSF